jgi:hypothetical protein
MAAAWKGYRAWAYKVERKTHAPSGQAYYHWTARQGNRKLSGDSVSVGGAEQEARAAIDRAQS